jgi:SPP1 family predicted phage head-tail adaptor
MIPNGTGSLRHSIDLYGYTVAKNGYGEDVQTWAKYDTVWAAIYAVSSSEEGNAQQIVGVVTHKVVIRYLSTVDIKHRIYFGSRVAEIVSVSNEGQGNEYLVLLCNEVLS